MIVDILIYLAKILVAIAYICWELVLKWIPQVVIFGIIVLPPVLFLMWTWNRFLKLAVKWQIIFVAGFVLFNTLYETGGNYHPLMGIGNAREEQLFILPLTYGPGIDQHGTPYPRTEIPFAEAFNDSLLPYIRPVYRFANRVAMAGLFVPNMWLGIMGYYILLMAIPLLLVGSYRRNIFNRWGLGMDLGEDKKS